MGINAQKRIEKKSNLGAHPGTDENFDKSAKNKFFSAILKNQEFLERFIDEDSVQKLLLAWNFDNLDEGLNMVDVDKAGEFIVFNRAWEYIQKVDPDNLVAQEALFRFSDIHLKVALELSINYFQEHEEYEKCSHLKKNLEFVKLLLT